MSDVRVVALCEKLNDSRYLRVVAEQNETESGDSCPSDVVRDIGHGDVKQLADGLVVTSTSVSKSDGEHGSVSQDSVLKVSAAYVDT